jgi:flagellar basal-body rod protein FlgC
MSDVLSIALSGLTAQKMRLEKAASNIANAGTSGAVPKANAPSSVYKPLSVSFASLETGGVKADITADPKGYSPSYDPSNTAADAEGFIAVPNVDIATEIVDTLLAKTAFKANLAVIRAQDEISKEAIDIIA